MNLVTDYSRGNIKRIKRLYKSSFPKPERKPFGLILKKVRKDGTMEILTAKSDSGEFLGFAVLMISSDILLVDYLAIAEGQRGKGAGSEILKYIFKMYEGYRVILEIENTSDKNAENYDERIRRKKFYMNNGMKAMPFLVSLFGVELEVLTYNCEVTYQEYENIFADVFSPKYTRFVKLINSNV